MIEYDNQTVTRQFLKQFDVFANIVVSINIKRVRGSHFYIYLTNNKIWWRKATSACELNFAEYMAAPINWRMASFEEVFENAPEDVRDVFIFNLDKFIELSSGN